MKLQERKEESLKRLDTAIEDEVNSLSWFDQQCFNGSVEELSYAHRRQLISDSWDDLIRIQEEMEGD